MNSTVIRQRRCTTIGVPAGIHRGGDGNPSEATVYRRSFDDLISAAGHFIGRGIAEKPGMTRKSTTLLLLVGTLIAAGAAAIWWFSRGPDVSQFADLREPRLTRLDDQRMLVVEATGDPSVVSGSAFKLLFSTYYKLSGISRSARPPAPRARWVLSLATPRNQWIGRYALPVPDSVVAPPAESSSPMRTSLTTWSYGDVAEILHVGRYSTEEPDINRLRGFIDSHGYRVVGDHEEEYVKGPGMIFAGDPDKYLTIIRLRVEKAARPTSIDD